MPGFPRLHEVDGFAVAAVHAGIKSDGKLDLGLIQAAAPATAAAVFTQNRIAAAPVQHSRRVLATHKPVRAILANAGNANCCTGPAGRANARACARRTARAVGCRPGEVLLASTGIIGEPLPMESLLAGIDDCAQRLTSARVRDKRLAEAIRTLDTHAKEAGTTCHIGGRSVTLAAAAKGIGMCAPHMATVLVFILTDAAIARPTAQALLADVVAETFNRVSVDSDTSTNDSCFLLASGTAGHKPIRGRHTPAAKRFAEALHAVCLPLARMLAADGEGATRFIEVRVRGARTQTDADRMARAICESPLVKTAVCGADPNWGRILMAAGKTGAGIREANCRVTINGHRLYDRGAPTDFKPQGVARAMRGKEVVIELEVGRGRFSAEMFGCDLTHGYVTINADYHT